MANCRLCNLQYGQAPTILIPRILSCGHSYCQGCIQNRTMQFGYFQCLVCPSRLSFEQVQNSIINEDLLLTAMMAAQLKKQLEAERYSKRPVVPIKTESKPILQEKCMYDACNLRRSVINGKIAYFCSKECETLWRRDTA